MKSFKQILESVLEYAPEATSEVEIMPEIKADSDDPKEVKLKKKKVKAEGVESEYTLEIDGEEYDLVEVKMDGKDDNNPNQKCWKGYVKRGTKKKGGKEVNNCVKAGFEPEGEELEEKKGLYANIHAKRKRGERAARPGEKDYPAKDAFAKSARTAKKEEYVAEKKLDPVGKADADIDNDGDVDKSDKYLHNRRKAIAKAIGKKKSKQQSCYSSIKMLAFLLPLASKIISDAVANIPDNEELGEKLIEICVLILKKAVTLTKTDMDDKLLAVVEQAISKREGA